MGLKNYLKAKCNKCGADCNQNKTGLCKTCISGNCTWCGKLTTSQQLKRTCSDCNKIDQKNKEQRRRDVITWAREIIAREVKEHENQRSEIVSRTYERTMG